MSAHVGTHQHMSACPNVLTHVSIQDKSQMADIRGAESGLTCRHMSAHIGMSKCADRCQQQDKFQMVEIRGVLKVVSHVGTYQHMSPCPQVLTHGSI